MGRNWVVRDSILHFCLLRGFLSKCCFLFKEFFIVWKTLALGFFFCNVETTPEPGDKLRMGSLAIVNFLKTYAYNSVNHSGRSDVKASRQGWGAGKFFSGSGSWLFLQAAPAPDFFPSGSGSWYFFRAAPAPRAKKNRLLLLTIG